MCATASIQEPEYCRARLNYVDPRAVGATTTPVDVTIFDGRVRRCRIGAYAASS